MDTGTPVSEDYHVPFKFTGELKKVVIEPGKNGLAASDERDTGYEMRDPGCVL
jgi:arylsulfatase